MSEIEFARMCIVNIRKLHDKNTHDSREKESAYNDALRDSVDAIKKALTELVEP